MQGKNSFNEIAVRYIKGVGPQKADLFAKIGIENISDLLYYLPRRYEDRREIVELKDVQPGKIQGVMGEVLSKTVFTAKTGKRIFELVLAQGNKKLTAVWYNQPFMQKFFNAGQIVVLYGKVELYRRLQITHPDFEILEDKRLTNSLNMGRIVPVYSLTENLKQKYIRNIVNRAVSAYLKELKDCLPTQVRARRKLVDFRFAVENIHFPHSYDNLEKAYRRLVFEEFFILQAVMARRRKKLRKRGIKHEINTKALDDFEELFSFELTKAQKKCIEDIKKDMSGERSMYRLLQGDVGSGKTVVSMYALLVAVSNGYQAAMMAPTEILARQHYVTISKTFMPLGINVRLLVGGIDRKDKEKVKKELDSGDADIVIGTHALFQENISYNKLGLVIVDEQHKFGVHQRKKLSQKGEVPDMLVMTATPIPRSLVLSVFGDMDMSLLTEKPAQRADVTTYFVGEDRRALVYEFILDEIKKGRQVFIVCPRIKKTGSEDIKSTEEMFEELRRGVFRDVPLALMHGRMKSFEKERIMRDFRAGKYAVLVATTVIEVGVDIPNVTVMMVEHAERYGLAQLHQLRGRIGRGKHASYCILLGSAKTEVSCQRLSAIAESNDGFKIAEKDLDIRGPGEFFGTRQSGLPELRFGNIVKDFAIMEEAREEAFSLISEDPELKLYNNQGVKESIIKRFRGKWNAC
ncbi:MAG: ATP-dependent DNA helicase RecG [Candidatus Omnitrophica bacterium]|nr:ATP-dependent DNA helicase RecG [Candidatus Omnitrophota bacterium]